jgi:hypothetical protein
MTVPAGDYITEVINLLLQRLDRMNDLLERIADALEEQE